MIAGFLPQRLFAWVCSITMLVWQTEPMSIGSALDCKQSEQKSFFFCIINQLAYCFQFKNNSVFAQQDAREIG